MQIYMFFFNCTHCFAESYYLGPQNVAKGKMSETLTIATGSKESKYQELIPQVQSMLEGEDDLITNMANVASMIHETFGFLWTGFYRVKKTGSGTAEVLILGTEWPSTLCAKGKSVLRLKVFSFSG